VSPPPNSDHYAISEIDRVLNTCRLQSPHGRSKPTSRPDRRGEYDSYYALPPRRRRRLAGAGFILAYPNGLVPDELSEMIEAAVPGLGSGGTDPLVWYFNTADRYIRESRQIANQRKFQARDRRAREENLPSYYYNRLLRNALSDSEAAPAGNHDTHGSPLTNQQARRRQQT